MRKMIFILGLFALLNCFNEVDGNVNLKRNNPLQIQSSLDKERIILTDTIKKRSTRHNKELKTAEEYFEHANTLTKTNMFSYDSITAVIASDEYFMAIKLNPKFWQARRNYAREMIFLKKYDAAIEQLTEALKIVKAENNPDLNLMRGQAFYEKGNYQKAIDDFDNAMKYEGNSDFTLLFKAKAQWKLGQFEEACENYKKAIALTPYLADSKEFIICK